MFKIDNYILPAFDYWGLSTDNILAFDATVESCSVEDKIFIPYDYYDIPDSKGITALDYLYGDSTSDVTSLLLELVGKQESTSLLCSVISKAELPYCAFLIIDKPLFPVPSYLVIKKSADLLIAKMYYLEQSADYNELVDLMPSVFQNVVFLDDAFDSITRIGRFQDSVKEIIKHLYALDQFASYIYQSSRNESEALSSLAAQCNIICSGKGSSESISYKKHIEYNGSTYDLTCNPHTKLFNAYSDARIYFCWGRDEIEDHKIIVVKVGDHWR